MANHTALEKRLRVLYRASGRDAFNDLIHAARGSSRVLSNDTSGVTSNGGTLNTAVHQVDMTEVTVMIGGTIKTIAALNDESILTHARACALDGSAPAALSDNRVERVVAVVSVIVDGEPDLAFVHGAEAKIGDAIPPTPSECRRALELAKTLERPGFDDYLPSGLGVTLAHVTLKRRQQVTATFSGTPEVGDTLSITVDDEDPVEHVADSTTLNDEVGDLRTALDTALGADYIVGGTGAVITVEGADALDHEMVIDAAIVLDDAGDLAVVLTDTDQVTASHSDPATDLELKGQRLAGALAN